MARDRLRFVIPAQAGILCHTVGDSRLRGNDRLGEIVIPAKAGILRQIVGDPGLRRDDERTAWV